MNINEFVWTEKYRPSKIDDIVLPAKIKKMFRSFIESGNIPNLLLCGSAGTGKTTAAIAMLEELNCDYLLINGSLDNGIDTLRNEIKNFAQTLSLFKPGRKFVIIDEADYLKASSTQPALRNFMEEYSISCGFILTCNHRNRIIPELHSRCSLVDFKAEKEETPRMMAAYFNRIKYILNSENVEFDENAIAKFMKMHYPDMRRTINELQTEATGGKITSAILIKMLDSNFKELVKSLKEKNFTAMRRWVSENENIDFQTIMRRLYDSMNTIIQERDTPILVKLCAHYQYMSTFSVDQEVNTTGFLTEVMASVDFI